jgi:hypothetical protein
MVFDILCSSSTAGNTHTIWRIQLQGFGAVQYALFEVAQFHMTCGEVVEASYAVLPRTSNRVWFVQKKKAHLLSKDGICSADPWAT